MMNALDGKPPMSFWTISAAALIWNLFGFMVYVMQVTVTPEVLADSYSEEQVAFIQSTPVWATSAFAIAVTTGVLACVMLLLRRSWAITLFVVSFVAVLLQNVHSFVLNNALEVFGPPPAFIQATVIAIGLAMIWYSRRAKERGWLS